MSTSRDKIPLHESLDNLKLFSAAVESAMDGIQIVDFEGTIIFSNKAVENIYGFTHEELKGTHVNDMNVDPDFASREILPSIQKDGSWMGELMVKHKKGHHFPIWLNTSLVNNNEGEPIAMLGIIRDITELKMTENNLKLFSAAVESAMDGIQIVDFEGTIIFSNKAVENIYGFTHEELKGTHVNDMNVDPDFASREILPSIQKDGSWMGELMVKHKKGHHFPIWLNTSLVNNNEGEPIAMLGVIRDITERKEAERKLRESEERFRGAFESVGVGASMASLKGEFIKVNRALCEMLGYTEEELLTKTFSDVTYPDDVQIGLNAGKVMVAGEVTHTVFEKRYVRKDGQLINVVISPAIIRDSYGNPLHFIALFQDITERKKTEENLRLFSKSVENAIDGIQIIGTDRKIIYSNEVIEKMYGYTQEELSEKPVNEMMGANPEFGEKVILPSIKKTGSWGGETMGRRKDGTTFPVWLSISTILGDDNKPIAMVSIVRDISDIKRAEKRIVTLIDALPDIIYFKDTESRNLVVNLAFAKLTGLKKEEAQGKTDKELLPPALAEHCRKQDEEVMRAGRLMRYEESHEFHGEKMFQETIKVPLHDDRGVVIGLVGITRDITDQKRAENATKESEERMRILMESAQDIILMQDLEGRYTYYNANPSYSLKEGSPLGKLPHDFHDKETAKKIMSRFHRVIKDGESLSEEVQVFWQGEPMWMHEVTSPVRDADGNIRGVVTIARNITEMKHLEEQLRHSQKMEAIGTLTSGIAHEFFNILTAIKGGAEFLDLELPKDNPLSSYVNVIQSSVERATRLTQSLLLYSRKHELNMESIALDEVTEHVINLISTLVTNDIKVKLKGKKKGLIIFADRDQLEQVLMNLAVNSIDAMPNGGTLTINIDTADIDIGKANEHAGVEPGQYAILSVTDTGVGMDAKTQEKMFEPFFTTKDVGKGTGLGLSMVYGIISRHNGYITVVSQPDRGSTFKIYLPLSSRENTR